MIMIPVAYEDFRTKYGVIHNFDRYHGTNFKIWDNYFAEVGGNKDTSPQDDYANYLVWVRIQNSPLNEALK